MKQNFLLVHVLRNCPCMNKGKNPCCGGGRGNWPQCERIWSLQTREKRQAACGHPQTPKDRMRAHIQRKTQEPHKPMPEEEQSPYLHRFIPQMSLSCLHCPRWEKLTMH